MFGLGFWEIAVIMLVALLVFGPSKLPGIARTLGKTVREFQHAAEGFKDAFNAGTREEQEPRPPDKQPLGSPAEAPPPAIGPPAQAAPAEPAPSPPLAPTGQAAPQQQAGSPEEHQTDNPDAAPSK